MLIVFVKAFFLNNAFTMAESCFTDRVCIGELFEILEKMGDVISSA